MIKSNLGFIRELAYHAIGLQWLFASERSWLSNEKENSFALVGSDGENGDELWTAKIPLVFSMSVRGGSWSLGPTFLQYLEVIYLIYTNDKTLATFYLQLSTYKVNLYSRPLTSHWCFGTETLKCRRTRNRDVTDYKDFCELLRADHVIETFTERIPLSLLRSHLIRIYSDFWVCLIKLIWAW